MTYSSDDLIQISKIISNSKDFEEALKLEKIFEDSEYNTISLQMGYLKNGDFILYESFINTEIITYEEYYFNWGTLLTIRKRAITAYNEKEYEFSKSFDEIIGDFKKETQKKYKNMEDKDSFLSMEQQNKIYSNNMTFQSYNFEIIIQSKNINYTKDIFSL